MRQADDTNAPAVAPMVRWRRVCARIDAGQAPDLDDATWLAECAREAIEHGVALREAFGLPGRGGAGGLQRVAMLARRDALLRALRAACFASMDVRPAAREIAALATRQRRLSRPPRDEAERRIAELLAIATVPGERRLRAILGHSKAL